MLDDPTLFQQLDNHGRRRLWLLQLLLDKLEPEEALSLAQQMETFILGSAAAKDAGPRAKGDAGSAAGERSDGWTVRPAAAPAEREPDETQQRGRLLAEESLRDFAQAIAAGLSNAELARRFGFTPRQANGLRMGLTRRNPALRAAAAAQESKPQPLDRATELRLQEAFLQTKAAPAATLDDVVQFLRQRGDVVFRSGTGFSVNNRLTLTAEELVARANKKRSELGQAPFAEHVGTAGTPEPVGGRSDNAADAGA
jgi:hypothetical protein